MFKEQDLTLEQFKSTLPDEKVEAIFLIRLFAVFEGILKEHHAQFHANDAAPPHASVSWHIDRLAFFNRSRISEKLAASVHEVRRYRNSLVHSLVNVTSIDFDIALSTLSKFAIKLPEV